MLGADSLMWGRASQTGLRGPVLDVILHAPSLPSSLHSLSEAASRPANWLKHLQLKLEGTGWRGVGVGWGGWAEVDGANKVLNVLNVASPYVST